ncbi:MAG: hypothetical protein Kow0092_34920 [Deferrisomatales bacterium]
MAGRATCTTLESRVAMNTPAATQENAGQGEFRRSACMDARCGTTGRRVKAGPGAQRVSTRPLKSRKVSTDRCGRPPLRGEGAPEWGPFRMG